MSNFFVPIEVYEKRISKCKSCVYYFKPTGNCKICGCFMKIKARISHQHCPKYLWTMHDYGMDSKNNTKEIPKEVIDEVKKLWPDIKSGRAKNQETKRRMFELYNIIYNGQYDIRTSCGSCSSAAFKGISEFRNKYLNYDEEI